jgi:hypothetical protein
MYDYPYITDENKGYEKDMNIQSAFQRLQTINSFVDRLRPGCPSELERLECPYLDELEEIRNKIRLEAVNEFTDQVIKISLNQVKPRIN